MEKTNSRYFRFDCFIVDKGGRNLLKGDNLESVDLSRQCFALLLFFMEKHVNKHNQEISTHDEIAKALGQNSALQDQTFAHKVVCKLRHKLDPTEREKYIKTSQGASPLEIPARPPL